MKKRKMSMLLLFALLLSTLFCFSISADTATPAATTAYPELTTSWEGYTEVLIDENTFYGNVYMKYTPGTKWWFQSHVAYSFIEYQNFNGPKPNDVYLRLKMWNDNEGTYIWDDYVKVFSTGWKELELVSKSKYSTKVDYYATGFGETRTYTLVA